MFIVPLLFVPWVTVIVGLFVAVIGFAWSPFAAAIGAFVASRRQENVVGAAISSAFYAFVSIILWIFFVIGFGGCEGFQEGNRCR